MTVIGITGTLGAGKGTIVELLKEKGFAHFSARDFIVEKILEANLPINRDTMTYMGNLLRKEHTPSYVLENLYYKAKESGQNSVLESVRNPMEVEFLRKQENFILLAVTADIEKRYQRIRLRKSETDNVSFETFKANEEREMQSSDVNSQNLLLCIEKADIIIDNSGTIEELREKFDEIWEKIIKK